MSGKIWVNLSWIWWKESLAMTWQRCAAFSIIYLMTSLLYNFASLESVNLCRWTMTIDDPRNIWKLVTHLHQIQNSPMNVQQRRLIMITYPNRWIVNTVLGTLNLAYFGLFGCPRHCLKVSEHSEVVPKRFDGKNDLFTFTYSFAFRFDEMKSKRNPIEP